MLCNLWVPFCDAAIPPLFLPLLHALPAGAEAAAANMHCWWRCLLMWRAHVPMCLACHSLLVPPWLGTCCCTARLPACLPAHSSPHSLPLPHPHPTPALLQIPRLLQLCARVCPAPHRHPAAAHAAAGAQPLALSARPSAHSSSSGSSSGSICSTGVRGCRRQLQHHPPSGSSICHSRGSGGSGGSAGRASAHAAHAAVLGAFGPV